MSEKKRGFLQALLDEMVEEDVKYGEKGKPRKGMSERGARKKTEDEAWAELTEEEED